MASTTTRTPEQVGDYYDQGVDWWAEVFGDNSHVGYWSSPDDPSTLEEATDHLTDLLISRLGAGPGTRVLDVGCGTGRPAIRLARTTGCSVVGVAVSAEQVRRANQRAEREGLAGRVSFQVGNAVELDFPDGSFDAAWALESIMHMPGRGEVLDQVARVVRPGAPVVLTDLFEAEAAGPEQRAALEGYLRGMESSLAEIDEYPGLVRAAGLRIAELLDITGSTQARTRREVANRLELKRAELTARFGPEGTAIFERMAEQAESIPEIGYLLLVARRAA